MGAERAQARHDDASTLRQALPALRVALAEVATWQAAAVLAEAMVDGRPAATALPPTAHAYWVVRPEERGRQKAVGCKPPP